LSEATDITTTTANTPARGQRRDESLRGPLTLPQWVIELIVRPILHTFFKVFFRLRLTGVENIPPRAAGGLVIAANHQTYFDPFWISAPIKRPIRYLAWNEAFGLPVVGTTMGLLGAWPLQLEKSDPTAIRRALAWLRGGGAVMIFPEGGRALPDGATSRFKLGAARIALEANVPVLPVTIRGGHRAWPRGWMFPRPARVEIIYHPPRKLSPQPGEDIRQCARRETESLAKLIESAL